MSADWDRIKSAFHALVELPAAERPPLIDRLCPDTEVRREVESLLAAHDASTQFLQGHPAAAFVQPPHDDEFIGQLVGPYRVIEQVGAGGMGVVYHAVRADATFEMHVALKIVKRGMDSDDVLRRFREERQTLARLDHPNIAKLLDGGSTTNGRPYLVMEYVRGTRLDRYCDQRRLTVRDRLRLFDTICRAVQHAHQNLVIHRDIKPDNILVTDEGVPKLVDFGIARVLDPGADGGPAVTRLVERRMTLAYASPEQVRGEAMSTASDVYSLGVVLYELLTGRWPYRQALLTPVAHAKAIDDGPESPSARAGELDTRPAGTEEEAPRPEAVSATRRTSIAGLRRQLSGDLDTIVLKSIHREPGRRYPSVQQLADDIDRHLKGLPVLARPDSFGYRSAKFIGRHRAGIAALALVMLAVAAGIAGTVWQARAARAERDRAQAEANRATQISDFIVGVLRSAEPEEQGRNVTVAEALDRATDRAEQSLAQQPDELATIRVTIGSTYLQLGQIDKAIGLLERGLELRRTISGPSRELAEAVSQLGSAYEDRGDLTRAEPLHREALAISQQIYDPDHPVIAARLRNVASVLMGRGALDEAETIDRRIVALLRKTPPADTADLAESLNNLAVVVGTKGNWDEAVELQREALDVITRLRGAKHPDVATALSNFATALEASKRYDEADQYFKRALALRTEILGDEHPATAWTRYSFASMLTDRQQTAPATELIGRVLALRGRVLPDSHPLVAAALQVSGRLAMARDDLSGAERDFRESLRLRTAVHGDRHWLVASSQGFVGDCLMAQGRFADAERLLLASRDSLVASVGAADSRAETAEARLTALYQKWGRQRPPATP